MIPPATAAATAAALLPLAAARARGCSRSPASPPPCSLTGSDGYAAARPRRRLDLSLPSVGRRTAAPVDHDGGRPTTAPRPRPPRRLDRRRARPRRLDRSRRRPPPPADHDAAHRHDAARRRRRPTTDDASSRRCRRRRPHLPRRPPPRPPRPRHPTTTTATDTVICVVVPVHNEERSVALLYDELRAALEPLGDGLGGGLRRRRLDRRHVRGADAAARGARQRPRRPPAAQLRQVRRARGRLRAGARRRRRDDRRRPPGRPGRDPAPAREARRGLRPRLRLEDAAARPAGAPRPLARSSTGDGRVSGVRLHDVNCGLKAYRARGRARAPDLRRAAPLHPGARALPRLPRRRAAGQPPPARARALALRRRALRCAASSTCSTRLVHGPLPPPAAAPLRRPRARARRARLRDARLPDRRQAARPRDRPAAAADCSACCSSSSASSSSRSG